MRVLVSNDDGVDALGIKVLAQGLRDAGHDVVTVAPDRDRSGASNSLSLDRPLRARQMDESTWERDQLNGFLFNDGYLVG